ncbi:hypothetical protein GEOBRER4_n3582 [Citrifermentans bremense]|uniref:Uncharacterized protein n=1 Tax=Citrifermentans bremense TaxID=60035 RepID=A0A6S6M4P4_9BACT|nr:hypothetical protein [Citrifermentans bremense]BCG48688.1 hypothetical protein GEOBRER4_n3582 [Citrifermentans bremense]
MFNWFRKKQENLVFEDNASAFAHACSIGYTPLIGGLVPALVEEDAGLGRDGEHSFLISIAGPKGAMKLWSCTLKESKSYPKEGDFVGFRIVTIAPDVPEPSNLIGYIACRLQPVLVPGKGWAMAVSYTPDNIKPAIRLG